MTLVYTPCDSNEIFNQALQIFLEKWYFRIDENIIEFLKYYSENGLKNKI